MNHQKEKASFLSPLLCLKKTIILGGNSKIQIPGSFRCGFFCESFANLPRYKDLIIDCLSVACLPMFEGCVVVVVVVGMVGKALNVGIKTPFEKEGWWMMVGFFIWGREVSLGFCFFWKDVN